MKPLRVSWSEGMFLGPQHFQLWDRHHAATLHARIRGIQPLEWGLLACVVEEEALSRNEFALERLEVVFKDGLYVSAPDVHPLPPPRRLPVEGSAEALDVAVAVPLRSGGVPAVRLRDSEGNVDARFVETLVVVEDESDPSSTVEVPVSQPNIRFVLPGDPSAGLGTIPVARLRRTMAGGFTLDERFIPPALSMDVTPRLPRLLNQTYGRMVERINELTGELSGRFGQASMAQEEQLAFWYLSVLNGALPRIKHLLELPAVHPSVAFLELVSLAGALTSFVADEIAARNLPSYTHDALTDCVDGLEEALQRLLSTMFTRRCVPIQLSPARRYIWRADIPAELLKKAHFLLCVRSRTLEGNPGWFTVHAKVGASDRIDHLIARRLGGVQLVHMPRPPAAVPARPDGHYFKLEESDEDWKDVQRCSSISVFVPRLSADDVKLELLALQE